jgi:serine acetyltransferase
VLQAFLAVSWQYQLSNTSVSACGFLAAQIGKAILLDHGTGVVIGETAVIGDRVSMLQGVTLGGTGKAAGDRHPKIQEGVLIGAGATILGNIVVGRGAMVAAGSLVLKDVPAHRFNCHPLHLKVLRVEGSSLDV